MVQAFTWGWGGTAHITATPLDVALPESQSYTVGPWVLVRGGDTGAAVGGVVLPGCSQLLWIFLEQGH